MATPHKHVVAVPQKIVRRHDALGRHQFLKRRVRWQAPKTYVEHGNAQPAPIEACRAQDRAVEVSGLAADQQVIVS